MSETATKDPTFTESELHALHFLPTFRNVHGSVEHIGYCEIHDRECIVNIHYGEHLDKAVADSAWEKHLSHPVVPDFDPFADEDPWSVPQG